MSNALTSKQEAFAVEVAKGTNVTAAYRIAYQPKGSSATTCVQAHRTVKNPRVAARIAELLGPALDRAAHDVERAVIEAARIGFSDVGMLYDADGNLKPIHEMAPEARAAIAAVETEEVREDGEVVGHRRKVKLWDKNSALDKLFKFHGLYAKDNAQHPSTPLQVNIALVGPRE